MLHIFLILASTVSMKLQNEMLALCEMLPHSWHFVAAQTFSIAAPTSRGTKRGQSLFNYFLINTRMLLHPCQCKHFISQKIATKYATKMHSCPCPDLLGISCTLWYLKEKISITHLVIGWNKLFAEQALVEGHGMEKASAMCNQFGMNDCNIR